VRRRLGALALVALAVVPVAGCSGGDSGGYELTAYFPRAVALYAHSKVKLMGVDAGRVKSIEVEGERIKVVLHIDDGVPLPADVNAGIVPLSLIGERNILLGPPWRPGMPKAKDGDVIPLERTTVPVEPDEALESITALAEAIDPVQLRRLFAKGADAVEGNGEDFNTVLKRVAGLTDTLASHDQQLLDIIANVRKLTATLNQRSQKLGELLEDFSRATGVLAGERERIGAFLAALVRFVDEGKALVTKYETQLPGDVAGFARVVMTLRANADSVAQTLRTFDDAGNLLIKAHDPQLHTISIRMNMSPETFPAAKPLLDLLGLSCPPGSTCPEPSPR
jgi:phospholipid/cholesterol/gamma-HCH transport system substrate-binding protein